MKGTGKGSRTTPGEGSRLRPLAEPVQVRVEADAHGFPRALRERRRRTPRHVAAIRESWRIDDEWWRRPVHRMYHQVVLEDGSLVTLFQDLADGCWYLHA